MTLLKRAKAEYDQSKADLYYAKAKYNELQDAFEHSKARLGCKRA